MKEIIFSIGIALLIMTTIAVITIVMSWVGEIISRILKFTFRTRFGRCAKCNKLIWKHIQKFKHVVPDEVRFVKIWYICPCCGNEIRIRQDFTRI
jgi:uncharacterized protein with PIN domain